MADVTLYDDLMGTAKEIKNRGWWQGSMVDAESGSVCLMGGLHYAVLADEAFGPKRLGELGSELCGRVLAVVRRIESVVGDPVRYNDARGRTKDDIIGMLESAAAGVLAADSQLLMEMADA